MVIMDWYFSDSIGAYTGDRISFEDTEISDRPSPKHTWKNGSTNLQLIQDLLDFNIHTPRPFDRIHILS